MGEKIEGDEKGEEDECGGGRRNGGGDGEAGIGCGGIDDEDRWRWGIERTSEE